MSYCVLSCFSHVWLCDPVDCSPPGSSVHGILQARILEWVATPSSRGSRPRDWTHVSYIYLHWQKQVPYHCGHLGSPFSTMQVEKSFAQSELEQGLGRGSWWQGSGRESVFSPGNTLSFSGLFTGPVGWFIWALHRSPCYWFCTSVSFTAFIK